MKTLLPLVLALATTLPSFGKTFEGVIHSTLTAGKSAMQNEYAIKGDRMRVNMQMEKGQSSVGIFNGSTGEMYILMPEMKTYMVFGGLKKAMKEATQADFTVEETGRTEKIAGYQCAEFIVKDKKQTIEFWATTGLGRYMAFSDVQKNRGKSPAWADLLVEKGLFPLRTITKDRKGKVLTTMEATKVETKSIPDSEFEIPEGYQKFGMPNLGGLLKGLGV